MTEPNDAGAPPVDATATPPVGAAAGAGAAPEAGAAQDQSFLQKELAQARKDAAKYREELRLRDEATKTEDQKRQDRLTALEAENRTLSEARRGDQARLAAYTAAAKAGFRNPQVAYNAIAGSVEYDAEGKATNIDRLLTDLAKSDPYMVNGTADFGQGPRGAAPSAGANVDDMIRAAARR
jgi:hypothetical protein